MKIIRDFDYQVGNHNYLVLHEQGHVSIYVPCPNKEYGGAEVPSQEY